MTYQLVHDTTTVFKDRVVKVPSPVKPRVIIKKDTVQLTDTVDCPNENKEGMAVSGNLIAKYRIKNNRLEIVANNLSDTVEAQRLVIDSLEVKVQDYTRTINTLKTEQLTKKCPNPYSLWLLVVVLIIGHLGRSFLSLKKLVKWL